MDHRSERHEQPTRRRRLAGDDGVAAVEFAFIVPLLSLFIFGIISFGLILSFTQDMTRAAAEGSRAGAVAFPGSEAQAEATAATQDAVDSFGQSCNSGGMTCEVVVAPCATATGAAARECVTVTLTYDYAGNPFLPRIPLVSTFLPDTIERSSTARIND